MSDEDTLRRAAAKVREMAAAAPKGPWFPDHEEADRQGENADEEPFRSEYADDDEWRVGSRPLIDLDGGGHAWIDGMYVVGRCRRGFVEWVSLLGPQMGEPLAAVLDSAAEDAVQVGADFRTVALARALLDEQVPA